MGPTSVIGRSVLETPNMEEGTQIKEKVFVLINNCLFVCLFVLCRTEPLTRLQRSFVT